MTERKRTADEWVSRLKKTAATIIERRPLADAFIIHAEEAQDLADLITSLQAEVARLAEGEKRVREALTACAATFDRGNGETLIPFHTLSNELARRQNIARSALSLSEDTERVR